MRVHLCIQAHSAVHGCMQIHLPAHSKCMNSCNYVCKPKQAHMSSHRHRNLWEVPVYAYASIYAHSYNFAHAHMTTSLHFRWYKYANKQLLCSPLEQGIVLRARVPRFHMYSLQTALDLFSLFLPASVHSSLHLLGVLAEPFLAAL